MKNMKDAEAMVNDVEVSKEEETKMSAVKNVVKEEVTMEMQENNHEGLVRRFCVECGKEMWLPQGSRQSICEDCKQKKAQANAKRAKELANIRKEKLGLVTMNLTLASDAKDELKRRAREKGISVGDLIGELLGMKNQEEYIA